MSVSLYQKRVRGVIKWCVDHRDNGKRKQSFYSSRTTAELVFAEIRRGTASAKAWWARLRQADKDRILQACYNAHTRGHKVDELLSWSYELQPRDGPKLSDVINELICAKQNAGRSSDYTDALSLMLNKFAEGRGSMKVDVLTVADVERFLDAGSIASRATRRARLSTLFKFAVRRGYRADNPCERVESVTYVKPAPQVFTPEQFATAVEWLNKNAPHGLAWFALSTLCGLRPEEAEKTTKRDIDFAEGFIRVEAQTTKVRERRIVYPKKEALDFLRWAMRRGKLPFAWQPRRRMLRRLRGALGWQTWPKDITRHTAASYWLSSDGSAVHVAEMLGNSESVLKRDYKALVTRSEAQSFWIAVQRLANNRKIPCDFP